MILQHTVLLLIRPVKSGELSDEALAELADLDQIDIEARSYSDAVEAASICVART
jgi:hypothetical protein